MYLELTLVHRDAHHHAIETPPFSCLHHCPSTAVNAVDGGLPVVRPSLAALRFIGSEAYLLVLRLWWPPDGLDRQSTGTALAYGMDLCGRQRRGQVSPSHKPSPSNTLASQASLCTCDTIFTKTKPAMQCLLNQSLFSPEAFPHVSLLHSLSRGRL